MSEYFAGELLKLAFNRDTYTPPYDRFDIALVTDVPVLNADTSQIAEPVGGSYARATVPFNTANWSVVNYREVQNVNAVTFPNPTAFWGTIEGYCIFTSSSSNAGLQKQLVAVGRFTVPLRAVVDQQPQLPAGSILFGVYD